MMNQKFLRRINWTIVLLAIFFVVIIGRLFLIQVIDHNKYVTEAASFQTKQIKIPAERGKIYARDSDGEIAPLVMNEAVYDVFGDPQAIASEQGDFNQVQSKLKPYEKYFIPE
jgi:cell division protein FtsI/penicillin-binding protein 2